jgi:Family of unknown function (DUF5343)
MTSYYAATISPGGGSKVADKHPYAPGPGGVSAAISQFQKSFPKVVTADTLKKLDIAPKNESYIINVLRYIGAIDADGNRTEAAARIFSKSGEDFQNDFEGMLKSAYADLFALHGDEAWTLAPGKLRAFFRSSDQTSDLVGGLQTTTFQRLASFAGHGLVVATAQPKPATKSKSAKSSSQKERVGPTRPATVALQRVQNGEPPRDFGLTVRIEVNLPSDGNQEAYDRIFRSIRENLLNGK